MRKVFFIFCLAALSACDTGTKDFWGIAPQRVETGGMTFDVRVKRLMAEALRQNFMAVPKMGAIAAAAADAMRQASGCEVIQTQGDPSVIQGRLNCGGQKAPAFRKKSQTVICRFRSNKPDPVGFDDYHMSCD